MQEYDKGSSCGKVWTSPRLFDNFMAQEANTIIMRIKYDRVINDLTKRVLLAPWIGSHSTATLNYQQSASFQSREFPDIASNERKM